MSGASVVVIGNFDGVHRGHQAVLAQAKARATAKGLGCVVLTFDPHPSVVLGRATPPRLTTLERRIELLREHGADDVVVEPFTAAFATWTPERFARDLLAARLRARAVVVGENFRFGAKRAGDLATLRALGDELGFEPIAAEVAGDDRGPFSSTRVREAIGAGDVGEARRVLGRLHTIEGVVVQGDQLGRTLGFPTANLENVEEMLPAYGVYAVRVAGAAGVMNIGVRPTVSAGVALRVEVHLLDVTRDLYGARLRVELVARLRGEQKFPGLDALKAQIARDVESAREALRDW